MIRSFANRDTQRFFEGRRIRAFEGFRDQATRRLAYLDNAESLRDLSELHSNRLESLSGDRQGSTASESIGNGEFVFVGERMVPATLKLWTIIE